MKVNPHAVKRFRERTGTKKSDEYIVEKLLEMANKCRPAKFTKPKYELMAL